VISLSRLKALLAIRKISSIGKWQIESSLE
jgi:hypothetical protein